MRVEMLRTQGEKRHAVIEKMLNILFKNVNTQGHLTRSVFNQYGGMFTNMVSDTTTIHFNR